MSVRINLRRQRSPIIGWVFHAIARTSPLATSSAAVSPWIPKAFESFPPFVETIRASAVGVIAAATSTSRASCDLRTPRPRAAPLRR